MNATLLSLVLVVFGSSSSSSDTSKARKHSPYAPSLPYLTKEEEQKLDAIIDRFMDADIGVLRGEEAKTATRTFARLGPEAIPALVRGLNRAAAIQHSCPVVVIAAKLNRLLTASNDAELLEFVHDNAGAGVGRTRHANVIRDLRFRCTLLKNAVARRAASDKRPSSGSRPTTKSLRTMTVGELAKAASTERGPRLRQVLVELSHRQGAEVVDGLSVAAGSYDSNTQKLGRTLLDGHLAGKSAEVVQEKLKDDNVEVRKSAIRVVASKMRTLGGDLIDLLTDKDDSVRVAAHAALVKIGRGRDYGPPANATDAQREQAQQKWRKWWDRVSSR
jgi:hypothetical protein